MYERKFSYLYIFLSSSYAPQKILSKTILAS